MQIQPVRDIYLSM